MTEKTAKKELALATRCIHVGAAPDSLTGAVIRPRYSTSTFAQQSPGVPLGDWDYARAGNPTRDAVEELLASLELAHYGLVFASGLAAIDAIIRGLLQRDDKIVMCDDVYGGTARLLRNHHKDHAVTMLDMSNVDSLMSHFKTHPDSRMVWVESPTNPLLKEIDIQRVSDIAHQHNAIVVVDNTFASPVYQQPLQLGADVVIHSTSKYLGGHSDLIGGAIMVNEEMLFEPLKKQQFEVGAIMSPENCELLQRSIKTLPIRMREHQKNAAFIAEKLAAHRAVQRVNYPGYSGMIAFWLHGGFADVDRFLQNLSLITLAESLGGVESLINHPDRMTHASVPLAQKKALGIGENLLRLSVGIEDKIDLWQDIKSALDSVV